MGHPRRYFPARSAYFVTNRLGDGLPFVPNEYINEFLYGVIARAQHRHQGVTVCSFLIMGNHYHLLLVLKDSPEAMTAFMNYLDGEIAKLVVRWLGKRNVKVWAQRYHAAKLITADAALQKMAYTFANPVLANLCPTASSWTGCSSFFSLSGSSERICNWYRPSLAKKLPNKTFSRKLRRKLVAELSEVATPVYSLKVDPFGWMACFAETKDCSEERMKQQLLGELELLERLQLKERSKTRTQCPDPELLASQNPHKHFKPKNFGRRVFCISTCPELRRQFIDLYREYCSIAANAWKLLKSEKIPMKLPPGMFAPPVPPISSALPVYGYL